jgi:hypothetical protein
VQGIAAVLIGFADDRRQIDQTQSAFDWIDATV